MFKFVFPKLAGRLAVATVAVLMMACLPSCKPGASSFNVISFYTAKNDRAHISFVREANNWFEDLASLHGFNYDTTSNWNKLNTEYLKGKDVVIFLDSRPDSADQRAAFRDYMENGGAWMGFHFAAFALDNSAFPQNWDWYHETFLGSGEYAGNTWRPTPAVLRIEAGEHELAEKLPETFVSSPNEWYKWANDLRMNPDLTILMSVDPSSFPLGTGPKPHEIWHSGYYPVAWTNNNFKMLYFNMGHNNIDYSDKSAPALSSTFSSSVQNTIITRGLFWLAGKHSPGKPEQEHQGLH